MVLSRNKNGNSGDMVFSNMGQFWWIGCKARLMMVKFPSEIPQKVNLARRLKLVETCVNVYDPSLNRFKAIERIRLGHNLMISKDPREITQKV